MANMVAVAIWDKDQEAFSRPFFVRREAEAVRLFSDEVNRQDDTNLLWRHPDAFELYQLAEFNEETGEFFGSPRLVIGARHCIIVKGGSDVSE